MAHNDKVEIIKGILLANEEMLSDGYGYYCGLSSVDKTLTDIAEAILVAVEMPDLLALVKEQVEAMATMPMCDMNYAGLSWERRARAAIAKAMTEAKGEA